MKSLAERPTGSFYWWLLATLFLPLAIPGLVFKYLTRMKEKRNARNLNGKVVLITGASSGLGEALAHSFYLAGCKVVLAARRKEELERVRKDLLELHATVPTHPPIILPLDLSDLNSITGKVQSVLEIHGAIDILVNNGGISVRGDALSTAIDVDIRIMLVNYFGTVAMTKACLPSMIARKEGRIVCVSSVQGKFAIPHRSAYSASKHALQAFCDSLRAEVAKDNVSVTLISPGYINTALSMNALTGSGATYGKMDTATAAGASAEDTAANILKAIVRDEKDIIMAPIAPRAAYWLRHRLPSVYFWIMKKRAEKLSSQ
ncbi:dehydrogenase/reductase SDR family protein 7-like [Anopheles stephensi]|uniref:dehydrogenase/reductase SDR family protein 7-like n=1 Tax=Anopheles stephensi TaxID=30069 RepID=UPI0016587A85|nr:dehydrogenase/reductase SDR family protein 7-like [Anopheles stephensi]XP_035913887.1 dehydrogenase/reductase SDR family protein 7-like [Anopheles stephensi]